MKAGPAIGLSEFARRRTELMELMDVGGIAIIPGGQLQRRNGDVPYRFRQDSDFHYLSGFKEPDAVIALIPGRIHGESLLFCRDRDDDHERWHGEVTGPERARQLYGFDDAFPMSDIDDILPGLIEGKTRLYYGMGVNRDFDNQIIDWVQSIAGNITGGAQPPGEFVQLGQFLHELRLFKSPAEIAVMRRAAEVSAAAHRHLLMTALPGQTEYQLQAELEYSFACQGARQCAYPAIVAAGNNACILHYLANDSELEDGQLVLVDAGCELENYAADVTRTFPVGRAFNAAQAALYDLVLAAQQAAIAEVKVGNHWDQPHLAAVGVITQGLCELGLICENFEDAMAQKLYERFTMTRTGHWLGLDVHDVGEYQIEGQWRVFEAGMVTTIEPGLYIDDACDDVPVEFRGLGIRIEDDVLVTRRGPDVLSRGLPSSRQEIEQLRSHAFS